MGPVKEVDARRITDLKRNARSIALRLVTTRIPIRNKSKRFALVKKACALTNAKIVAQ